MITKHTFDAVFFIGLPRYVMTVATPHYRRRSCSHFKIQILMAVTTKINVVCEITPFSSVGTWAPMFRRNVLPPSSGLYSLSSLVYLVI